MLNKPFAIDVVGLNTIKHQRHQLAFAICCKFIHILVFYSLLYLICPKAEKYPSLLSYSQTVQYIERMQLWNIFTRVAPCTRWHYICHWTCCFHNSTPEQTGRKKYVSKDWWNVFNIGNSWPWAVYLSLERSVIKKKKKKWGGGSRHSL